MDNDVNTAAMVHYTGISHDDLNFHWVSTNRVMNHRGGIDIVIHFSEKKLTISIVPKFVVGAAPLLRSGYAIGCIVMSPILRDVTARYGCPGSSRGHPNSVTEVLP